MDIFDDIMNTLNLQGSLYFRTHFTDPWAVTVPNYGNAARFHLVIQGTCYVGVEGHETICLGPGDLIMIPKGASHTLSYDGSTQAPPLETVLEDTGYDGKGVLIVGNGDIKAATQMVCGHFNFRDHAYHPIIEALPDYVHVRVCDRATEPWLDDTLRLIQRRMFADSHGATAIVKRLSEIMFLEILKSNLIQSNDLRSIIAAFDDPQISQALTAMHSDPAHAWTVQSLAQLVGMSRSRFSDKFGFLLGTSPMSYLSNWRLQRSLEILSKNQCTIQEVATKTGYQSPAAFSRAFSNRFHVSPKVYQQQINNKSPQQFAVRPN